MNETIKPEKLRSRLRAVHLRGQLLNTLMGLATLSKWGIGIFLAGFVIDWLAHLSALSRVVILGALLAVSIYKAWLSGWQYFRSFSLAHSALRVEDHYKNLESLLVTGVQLEAQSLSVGTSAAMSELTIRRAEEAVAPLEAEKVVPFEELRRPAAVSAALFAVILVFAIINSPLLMAGLARIFTPWRAIAYPTRTHIELDGKKIVVKEGDSVEIVAHLSGEVPSSARLALRTGKGKPRNRKLEVIDDKCEYKIAAAFRSFDYSISAGDASTDWHTVEVIAAPRVEKTQISLVYPSYMNRPPETMEAMTLTVPEGVSMEWNLLLDRAVSSPTFSIEGGKPIPLELSRDGLAVGHKMVAAASGAYSFSWTEKEHNFSFTTAKHYLQVAPDQPPQVELTSPRKNLFATVGRKLVLAYRARDDHGIGESRIIYRRDNAAEQFVPFAAKASVGRSVQEIDWDYREAVKDLDVGESLTFAIEVSDLYPPPDGPHSVRSESRRVSFLSREDYLAKVHEQKDRLLSQLRPIYRQERAAYDVIKNLDPKDDAFEQICFLESSRQDILTERIMLLNKGIRELVEDLTANNITDKTEFEGLNRVRASLEALCKEHISRAASLLRDLGPSTSSDAQDVLITANAINDAARGLGSLVLQLGVREAMEVFARELHVIAQSQSALRVEALESMGKSVALATKQKELARWLGGLMAELSAHSDYSKAPLTIVRLSRMVKDLRNARVGASMQSVADLLGRGKVAEAERLQGEIISTIFELECHIRVGSEYEALLNARDLFGSSADELDRIGSDDKRPSPAQLKAAEAEVMHGLSGMHRSVRLLILPAIPAPQPRLLSEKPTQTPPVEELVASAQDSLERAVASLQAGKRNASRAQRMIASDSFRKLSEIIRVRLDAVTRTSRYAGSSGASMERSMLVRELLASQMRLTEKTEDAEYDETSGVYLAPSQLHLSKEVLKMRDRLARKNRRGSSSSRTVAPMLKMLEEASEAMIEASPALKANKLEDAIEHQDVALDALQAAMSFANHEANGWLGLANLLMTAEGIALPAKYMKDIVAEQRDLIGQTKTSTPESRKRLLKIQKNLSSAVYEVSMLLEGTGSALDFEQAMLFAASDMGLSALKLESGDVRAAMKAQVQATESVGDLGKQFYASEAQFYYFVTVMEFLQEVHTDGVIVLDKLNEMRGGMEKAEGKTVQPDAKALIALSRKSDAFSSLMVLATGRKDYAKGHASLTSAMKELKAGNRDAGLDGMSSAVDSLKESMDELRELMAHVAYVPSVEPIEAPPEYNVMLEMVDLLILQKDLSLSIYNAKPDKLAGLVSDLRDIEETAGDLAQDTRQNVLMVGARKAVAEALSHLKKSSRDETYARLHHSGTMLRQCILEYALYYVEIKRPRGGRRKKKGKSGIVKMFKMSNKLRAAYDKNWGGVAGDDPKSGRSEWEVLGSRDRAALNENFVRELPLEYREFLKDYYERLTK